MLNIQKLNGRGGIRTRDREVRNLSPYPLGHTPYQRIVIRRQNRYRLAEARADEHP